MTGFPTPTSSRPPESGFDGAASTRALIREIDEQKRGALLVLPGWLLVLMVGAVVAAFGLLAAGDYAQMYGAAAVLMPELPPWQLRLFSAALMLAYLLVWHSVGTRAYLVRQVVLGSPGNGGRPYLRAFGPWGVCWVLVGSAVLAIVALARAEVLALREADRAAQRILDDALGAQPDPALLDQARTAAYNAVFWPDLRWTAIVLALLALASVFLGMASVPVKQAAALALARGSIGRARRRVVRLQRAETAAHLELASRVAGRERATALAEMHDRELPHRFDAAKQRFRLALAVGLAQPPRTSVVLPTTPEAQEPDGPGAVPGPSGGGRSS